jgi:release factor glutamine methyltransferase
MDNLEYIKKYYKGNIEEAKKQLDKGIPVQYIVGNVNFYGYEFKVNKNVLIPRFETEELVNRTIKYINEYIKEPKIVDLGTGSGCIAVTLSKELDIEVDAVDISDKALEVAKHNNKTNNSKVTFYQGNMLEPLNKKYNVIISNPPYISRNEEIEDLVKNNEPELALYAENDGLYFYEEILKKCSNYLEDNYLIAFEIGYQQGKKIKELALKYLNNVDVSIEKDLSERDRFIFIKKM